jgi:hypothetical protein
MQARDLYLLSIFRVVMNFFYYYIEKYSELILKIGFRVNL